MPSRPPEKIIPAAVFLQHFTALSIVVTDHGPLGKGYHVLFSFYNYLYPAQFLVHSGCSECLLSCAAAETGTQKVQELLVVQRGDRYGLVFQISAFGKGMAEPCP